MFCSSTYNLRSGEGHSWKKYLKWKISTTLIARLLTFLFLSKEVHSPSSVEATALEMLIWIRLSIFRNLLYLPQCPRFSTKFIFLFSVQEICRTIGTWFAKRKIIMVHKTEGQSMLWKCFMNWKSFSEVFHYSPIKHYTLAEFYPFKVGKAFFAKE